MRFDDSLATILSADMGSPFGAQTAWRQLVDLMARGRVPADPPMLSRLLQLRESVPDDVRAASARALIAGRPPAALVSFFVQDELSVAAPVLRSVALTDDEWLAILPLLSPGARSVLRHRRDLSDTVQRGLVNFGAVDFVLPDLTEPVSAPAIEFDARDDHSLLPPEPTQQGRVAPEDRVPEQFADDAFEEDEALPVSVLLDPVPTQAATPFVALGQVARGLPFMAEALRHAEVPTAPPRYEIADLVARIDAFNQRREEASGAPRGDAGPAHFDFETDAHGLILGVAGVARGPLVGVSIADTAMQGLARFDGVAMGAFRRRSPFRDARLEIGGISEASGSWRVSAMPYFDPASGVFLGYRGSGRRPRRDEIANVREAASEAEASSSDSLRQLVHELRTPANAVAGFAELIESELLGPVAPVYRDRASAIRSMAADLLASVEDLDTAARIEGRVLELRATSVPLAPLIQRVLAELRPLAELRRAEIRFEPPAISIVAMADDRASERLVTRLFSVLLSNCVVGERLAASLSVEQGMATLRIDRPLSLTVETEAALLSEAGDDEQRDGAPLLGTGFSLRLIDKLGAEMGGGLTIGLHRVVLALPLGDDQRSGQAATR
ncbi:HAMP domain-containing histidine kinase [Sphingomonas sanguinis]|uniref:sensor histidine kinase n=1 Tax=Sphingomonas sp. LC-1 TaxID=3110957 RepID=UPI0021BB587C|nr:HAMP domain-containing sensor histidine kinase [Sphingomonas sp. LC-1]MCT8003218.1 HAMP domain-containing histidine kinase [Sphingomonas sp. LC-1]